MARIRTIKPEFWTSEQIVECSTSARLLFVGMWNFCDDGGNHVASLKTLKMEIFPGDDITLDEMDKLVNELSRNGLIVTYESDGKEYWHVTGWHHQKIDRPTFKYPKFDEHSTIIRRGLDEDSTSIRRNLSEISRVPARREGFKEKEKKVNQKKEKDENLFLFGKPNPISLENPKPEKPRKAKKTSGVEESILAYLSEKSGFNFKPVASNLSLISARLAEGYTEENLKSVIDSKIGEWGNDEVMRKYLRPKTIFNATNFSQYVAFVNSKQKEWYE